MKALAVIFVVFVAFKLVDGCSFSINVGNADTYEVKEIRKAMQIKQYVLRKAQLGMNVDSTLLVQANAVYTKYGLPIY